MRRSANLLLSLAMCGMSGIALAGSDSGFYLGGSVGTAEVDYSDNDPDFGNFDIDFKDDDNAYKAFAGYNFGLVPLLNLGVEAAYINFGKYEDEVANVKGKVELDAVTLSGLVGFNLGPVGLFGKAGLVNWDGDFKSTLGNASESGTDPAYGIGAKIQLGSFAVRAEYEMFDLDDFDVDYYSIGASYTF